MSVCLYVAVRTGTYCVDYCVDCCERTARGAAEAKSGLPVRGAPAVGCLGSLRAERCPGLHAWAKLRAWGAWRTCKAYHSTSNSPFVSCALRSYLATLSIPRSRSIRPSSRTCSAAHCTDAERAPWETRRRRCPGRDAKRRHVGQSAQPAEAREPALGRRAQGRCQGRLQELAAVAARPRRRRRGRHLRRRCGPPVRPRQGAPADGREGRVQRRHGRRAQDGRPGGPGAGAVCRRECAARRRHAHV
jgi:hypothetical protein